MNLPNKLTLIRVIMIPFIMFFYMASFIPYGKIVAIVLFIIAAYTDHLDGKIARKNHLVTDFGKFLDPIADKLLIVAILIMCTADGTIPSPWGVISLSIVVAREFIVSAFRLIAVTKNIVLAADIWGKIKTTSQCICMPILMLIGTFNGTIDLVIKIIAFVLLAISVIFTVFSGMNYIINNKQVIKDK